MSNANVKDFENTRVGYQLLLNLEEVHVKAMKLLLEAAALEAVVPPGQLLVEFEHIGNAFGSATNPADTSQRGGK